MSWDLQASAGIAVGQAILWRGAWSSALSYNPYDTVFASNNCSYISKTNNQDKDPVSNPADWDPIASAGPQGPEGTSGAPIGAMVDWPGLTEPAGWEFCYGQERPRVGVYADVFAALGGLLSPWGLGNGTTTFNMPDFRGLVSAGRDDMGGVAANRLTSAWGVNGTVLGANGGSQSHALTIAQMPAHTHDITRLTAPGGAASGTAYGSVGPTGSTGGGLAHPNVQPTGVVNRIIKYAHATYTILPGTGDVVGPGTSVDGEISTYVGTSGKQLGRLAKVAFGNFGFPRGHLKGLQLSNNATDATNDIDIDEGECRDSTNSVDIKLPALITKQLDVAWAAGNNQGGLDTGAIANISYHVFAIIDTTGVVDALFSASATAPTLPSGYTHFRRVGSIRRVSAAIALFTQRGDQFTLSTLATDYTATTARAKALLTLSVPTGISVRPLLHSRQITGTAGDCYQTLDDGVGSTNMSIIVCRTSLASQPAASIHSVVWTNTSAQIYLTVTLSAGTISQNIVITHGWIDRRGQDD